MSTMLNVNYAHNRLDSTAIGNCKHKYIIIIDYADFVGPIDIAFSSNSINLFRWFLRVPQMIELDCAQAIWSIIFSRFMARIIFSRWKLLLNWRNLILCSIPDRLHWHFCFPAWLSFEFEGRFFRFVQREEGDMTKDRCITQLLISNSVVPIESHLEAQT